MAEGDDIRARYFAELTAASSPHRQRAFEYEKLTVDFANSIFKLLTYLNGGALIALPAAVALFQVDIKLHKQLLISGAACFVAALLLICLSQTFAFFTMARRCEAESNQENLMRWSLGATHYPSIVKPEESKVKIDELNKSSAEKGKISDRHRAAGILSMWLSVSFFIAGCYFGAHAILG